MVSKELDHYIRKVQEHLHRIPEPAFQEFKTAAYIEKELKRMGYSVEVGVAKTGVTATLMGDQHYPCVAVRADMDCITHENDGQLIYRHSCGHDAHTSIALGVAKYFSENQQDVNGSVKFIFQPAEEIMQGAKTMVNEGALNEVDMLIGYHLRPEVECPTGSMSPALMHSAGSVITGKITGKTAHGGRPHLGVNVIDVMGTLINAVNAIRPDPQSATSIKFTSLSAGGGSFNVIPGSGSFGIDVRSRENDELQRILEKLEYILNHSANMHGAKITHQIEGGVPAPRYSERMIKEAHSAIESTLGKGKAIPPIQTPGGEDFHYYTDLTDVEAIYLGIGANVSPGLHDPHMTFDQDSLIQAVIVVIQLIKNLQVRK